MHARIRPRLPHDHEYRTRGAGGRPDCPRGEAGHVPAAPRCACSAWLVCSIIAGAHGWASLASVGSS
ncbi:hypothetical protein APASM_4239 [Actinosynnema pretiosum subsp. pretiosum]|nr:hypothetical protein APASM_4239 [Actinosynnema pretiosum subsp. pretiosum]